MDTNEIPIGERRSSAKVRTRYVEISQLAEQYVAASPAVFCASGVRSPNEAIAITINPAPATSIPYAILRGAEGSFFFAANALKIAIDTGVRATT